MSNVTSTNGSPYHRSIQQDFEVSNSNDYTSSNESTSLLGNLVDTTTEQHDDGGAIFGFEAKLWIIEFRLFVKNSIPIVLAYALQNSLQTVSVLVVGRLSPEALATAAFSYMFAMSTAWLIALGGTTALDTLASSTFTGSTNPKDLGVLLQRSFVVLTTFYVPVALLWLFSAPLFRFLGQEPYICEEAAKFLSVLIPGGLGYIYFEIMKKYLQAQGIISLYYPARPGRCLCAC